jgi:hypothetical protein
LDLSLGHSEHSSGHKNILAAAHLDVVVVSVAAVEACGFTLSDSRKKLKNPRKIEKRKKLP